MLRGVIGHNGYNSCLKCVTEGEYSYAFRTMIYPETEAPLRNDHDFRSRVYEGHHKNITILESITGLDMVRDFPIGDALHLIDLGITKRFLNGWKCGSLNNHGSKWSALEINSVSAFLQSCKLPREFKRPVRGLDQIARWKGTEFRTFLLYLSPIIVTKFFTNTEISEHFLTFFCAIQICSRHDQSSENYSVARNLIKDFLEGIKILYGPQMFCSNIHNLSHLMDDVERFGPLDTFDAYPFESKLFGLKRLIRSGNLPLAQVARRICEIQLNNFSRKKDVNRKPKLKKHISNNLIVSSSLSNSSEAYSLIDFGSFCIDASSEPDRWILIDYCKIVSVQYIVHNTTNGSTELYGSPLRNVFDFFKKPVRSSSLYIFASNLRENVSNFYKLEQITCKMVKINCSDNNFPKSVFLPLVHTLM